jgi:hypothetical protein
MNPLAQMVFFGELELQAKIARRASERLQIANDNFDHVEIWCSLQSILVAAGNVSKILWPRAQYRKRGDILRKTLQIEENNILARRTFRNHFEHYDERVEEWFSTRPNGVYIDLAMNSSLGPAGGIGDAHRGYNSFNQTLVFRGETLDIGAILSALDSLRNKCKPYTLQ